MTDAMRRAREIRERREQYSDVLDVGGTSQALIGGDIDWLLAVLAQAERERDSLVLEIEGWKQKNRKDNEYLIGERDAARAEVERLKREYRAQREALKVTWEAKEADLARVRAALEKIAEYWNGRTNPSAMEDACVYVRSEARAALEG